MEDTIVTTKEAEVEEIALTRAEKRTQTIMENLGGFNTGWAFVEVVKAPEGEVMKCEASGYRMRTGVKITHPVAGDKVIGLGVMKKYTDAVKPRKEREAVSIPDVAEASEAVESSPNLPEAFGAPAVEAGEEIDFEALLG